MKINSSKMFVAGFSTVLLSLVFSFGENQKPLTENDVFGLIGFVLMIVGTCAEKE